MRRLMLWPPAAYLLISIGSIFASMGGQRPGLLAFGIALQAIALCVALALALERRSGRPRPRAVPLAIAGVAAFYGLIAVVASDQGLPYVLAALGAFLIPGTATALAVATARSSTLETSDGHLVDLSREDQGPVPRLGFDDSRPLGDSPDLHDDLNPHDLPLDHPGRKTLEHEVEHSRGRLHDSSP